MKIIPVVDILGGIVVHAVIGNRKEYKPVNSVICNSAFPEKLFAVFNSLGFDEVYVADLDALQGGVMQNSVYKRVSESGMKIMLDAGISSVSVAEGVADKVHNIIICTESMKDLKSVNEFVERFGSDKIVVSIDTKEGVLLSKSDSIRRMAPSDVLDEISGMGVKKSIILDLSKVGTSSGPNESLVEYIPSGMNLIYGGGVGGMEDLEILEKNGVYAALVATALHTGKITASLLKMNGFL